MLKSTRFQAAVLVALGMLLGYAAASGQVRLEWFVPAATPNGGPAFRPSALEPQSPTRDATGEGPTCCQDGAGKAVALARLETHNKAVEAKAQQSGKKPNILAIWGDDIGYWNISAYNRGMMGYRTPNIDRIAHEGAIFTDCYGQQSCTAGRACFMTGQSPFRTGLTKVGLPGAREGLSAKDPTLAELLKPHGYVCGQFGKNHLGDRNEYLPMTNPKLADTVDSSNEPAPRAGFFGPPRPPVRIDFGAVSHPGRVRPNNEDHFAIIRRSRAHLVLMTNLPEGALPPSEEDEAYALAVADGMGGAAFGEMASMLALRTAWELGGQEVQWPLRVNADAAREIQEKFEAYAQIIHSTLQERGRDDPRLARMGTTLTVAYTVGLDAFLGHVGDSRAYLFRQGKLEQLTRDHTLAQEMLDTGLLPPGAFELRRLKHVLVNCLSATAEPVRVDAQHRPLASGDRLLLCSDGLTDMVPDEEIARTLERVPAAQDACQALVDQALEAGGRDNVTVVLARYEATAG